VDALTAAGGRAEGATAYVSLEPCDHHGKTPPCSQALVQAGVARVVYGAADPSSEAGGGAATLRAAGVDVIGPVWDEARSRAENPAFHHVARHGTPYVALKLAVSLDGRIAARPGASTRITGSDAEASVHRLRAGFDAILVGGGTVRADDPRLTVRHGPEPVRPPARMVLDSEARFPSDAALLAQAPEIPVHVFTAENADEGELERLEEAGAQVHPVRTGEAGLALDAVLEDAWELGFRSVLCEGGGRLAGSLLALERVQRLYLYLAPRTLGEDGVPAFGPRAQALDWNAFRPVGTPELQGRDALLVYDRQET
jgi:diaminohydroxyphosphoribosylaminopyrimidine deaminase/5-amino-6-(5-phosphoribosylamino)uracil reductase